MNFPGPRFHGCSRGPVRGAGAAVLITLQVGAVAVLLSLDPFWETPAAWTWVVLGWLAALFTVRWWWRDTLTMPVVLVGALLARLVLLPFPPLLSDDAYRYLWDGLVMHTGDSPYRFLPSDSRYTDLHHLVEFRRMNSEEFHSVYPPLTQFFFYLAASVRGLGFHASYVVLKLLFGVIEFAGILVVARILRPRDLMLYAWNPVVILAIAGQGHTETAMIGFLLLTVAAVHAGRPGSASLALAAAGWIKLVPFALFPLLVARFGWKRTLPGILAGAAGLLAFDADTLRNLGSSLKLYLSYFEFYAGPYFVLRDLGWRFASVDPRPALSLALAAAFGLAWLGICIRQFIRPLRFEVAAAVIFAAYLVCSRTVHPWYLGGILCLLPFLSARWRWPWLWLAAGAWGSYLFYADGTYWPFLWAGWGGWLAWSVAACLGSPTMKRRIDDLVQPLLRRRAAWKARQFAPTLAAFDAPRFLDLGASEGYVSEMIVDQLPRAQPTLVDLHDRFRVPFPQSTYDGRRMPFPDRHFDAAIASYTLHHCANPLATLEEMTRVSRSRVVLLESWGRTRLLRLLLAAVDVAANALRGGSWNERVRYRSIPEWCALAAASGLHFVQAADLGGLFHAKLLLEFEPLHHRTI